MLDVDIEEIQALYESGLAPQAIATILKVSRQTVCRRLSTIGIHIRTISEAKTGKPMSDAFKEARKVVYTGPGNPFYGKCHSEAAKAMISEAQLGRQAPHGKGSWYDSVRNGPLWMRSTYELRFCQHADDLCYSYDWEPKAFPLEIEGVKTTYRPDVFIRDLNLWVEIKGYWRDDAYSKFIAFKETYPKEQIVLMTLRELESFESGESLEKLW